MRVNDLGTKHFLLLLVVVGGLCGLYGTHYYFSNQQAQIEAELAEKQATIAAEVREKEAAEKLALSKVEAEKDLAISKEHGTWVPWSKKEE